MSVALLCTALSVVWVYMDRNHSVVVAAQPALLYVICFGSAMLSSTILLAAFDESHGWTEEMLGRACVVGVWFDNLGHMLVYCALFTKLWRVYRCMRMKSNNIDVWRVMWPSVFLLLCSLSILIAWTVSGGYGWERVDIDAISGESIGRCNGPNETLAYILPIYVLHFVPVILAGVMAWKTCGIDDLYSESKWVLAFILVQMQVLIVGVPLIFVLASISPTGKFIGYTLLTFSFPMSTIGLIILPKYLRVRRMKRNANAAPTPTRNNDTGRGGVREAGRATEDDDSEIPVAAATPPRPKGRPRSNHGPQVMVVTFD